MLRREVLKAIAVLPFLSGFSSAKEEYKFFHSKENMDLLMAGAIDRNIMVYDADAPVGEMTSRLISLGQVVMRHHSYLNQDRDMKSEDVYIPMYNITLKTSPCIRVITDVLCETKPSEKLISDCKTLRDNKIEFHVCPKLREYFDKYGGNQVSSDKYIALGVDMRNIKLPHFVENDEMILMSY